MKNFSLKRVYLYFFSALGLILVIIAGTRIISLSLKTFVLTEADIYYEYPSRPVTTPSATPPASEIEEYQAKQRTSQRQKELAESLAMVIVGFPLYLYHWRAVKKVMEEKE